MSGFHDQDVTEDAGHGRRGAGSQARHVERQYEIPSLFGRARLVDFVHFHPIDLSGCRTERGLDGRSDPEPTSLHRIRGGDGCRGRFGPEPVPSGILLPGRIRAEEVQEPLPEEGKEGCGRRRRKRQSGSGRVVLEHLRAVQEWRRTRLTSRGSNEIAAAPAMQVIPDQIRTEAAITTSTKRFLILQATACACIGSVLAQGFAGELHSAMDMIVKILSYHLSGRIGRTSLALRQQSPRIHTTAF